MATEENRTADKLVFGSSKDTGSNSSKDDSGFFLSPQPFSAKLVRCASTPLTDKFISSHLDFDSIDSSQASLDSHNHKTSSNVILDGQNKGPITFVNFDLNQEVSLYFKDPPKPHTRTSNSDSGFESDVSSTRLSIEKQFQKPSGAVSLVTVKSRDLYDKRKRIQARTVTQRSIKRVVHVAGSFCGHETIDFLYMLHEMGMSHVIEEILKHLSVEDLGRALNVNSMWNRYIMSDKLAAVRWKEAMVFLENVNFSTTATAASVSQLRRFMPRSSPRKPLSNVANLLVSPKRFLESKRVQECLPPPVASSQSKFRHRLFEEDKTDFKPEDNSVACPNCAQQSRANWKLSTAKCTSLRCQFYFCTKCQCSAHPNSVCRPVPRASRSSIISSKKSRSRLRRL